MSDAYEPEANEDGLLTTGEAAEILGCSIATVRRMADDGSLEGERLASWSSRGADSRGYRLQGHRRVTRASVERLKAEREQSLAALKNPPPDTLDT